MGDEAAAETVVDSDCRVLGFEGLRVIDASVMPSVVRANTHLTTVMIAEHMAERLETQGARRSVGLQASPADSIPQVR
jgi:choline dehydrogenase